MQYSSGSLYIIPPSERYPSVFVIPRYYDISMEAHIVQRENFRYDLSFRIYFFVTVIFKALCTCDFGLSDLQLRAKWYEARYGMVMQVVFSDIDTASVQMNQRIPLANFRARDPQHLQWPAYLLNHPESITRITASHLDLRELPQGIEEFTNLSSVNLEGNQFRSIPECIYRLPHSCTVTFSSNILELSTIREMLNRINAPDYRGPRISYSHTETPDIENAIPSCEVSLKQWGVDEDVQKTLLAQCSKGNRTLDLSRWLYRLKHTADYKSAKTNSDLIKDVLELLNWLAKETDQSVTDVAYSILGNAKDTCGDGVILSFNDLNIHREIRLMRDRELPELKELIIRKIRYQKVWKMAEAKIAKMTAVDPIEVHLYYETELREPLGLPIKARNRLYDWNVGPKEIDSARETILRETSEKYHLELLLEDPLWQAEIERRNPDFQQHKLECEGMKEKEMGAWDHNSITSAIWNLFKKQESTTWNPYFKYTQPLFPEHRNY